MEKKKEKQTWLHFSNMMLLVDGSWVFAVADIVMMSRLHHWKKTNTCKCAQHIFQSQWINLISRAGVILLQH